MKARRQYTNLCHSMKLDVQAQLGCPFRNQLFSPPAREQTVGLGQVGPLAGKRKDLTPNRSGTRRIRTLQTVLSKLNFKKNSVISQTVLQDMKA